MPKGREPRRRAARTAAAARYCRAVHISEVMTQGVVTAEAGDSLRRVGELMRDRNVGSVVICDGGRPVGVITDRDLALAVVADEVEAAADAGEPRLAPACER